MLITNINKMIPYLKNICAADSKLCMGAVMLYGWDVAASMFSFTAPMWAVVSTM